MPDSQSIATPIVRRLRDAGHVAYFAGGCVRDMLRGVEPKDYDIATSARPEEVQRLFPSTVAVGAHFGVICVMDRRRQFEVATFRSDGAYIDGRHPQAVTFSSPARGCRAPRFYRQRHVLRSCCRRGHRFRRWPCGP